MTSQRLLAALTCAALLLCDLGAAQAQSTRATLNSYNNAHITTNGVGAITGTMVNLDIGNLITSAGMLADTNAWTGLNSFSINPILSACTGYLLGNGGSAASCSPPNQAGGPITYAALTPDGYVDQKANITGGLSVMSDTSRACSTADANKVVVVAGAGTTTTVANPSALITATAQTQAGASSATRYVEYTYVDIAGNETLPSSEVGPVSVASGHLLVINPPPFVAGAIGWHAYVSATSGAETRQTGGFAYGLGFGEQWPEQLTGPVAGASAPSSNATSFTPPLTTTVASCSGASYVLAATAGASVTNSQWALGTDNCSALNALASTPNGKIRLPLGSMVFGNCGAELGHSIALSQTALEGGSILAPIANEAQSISSGTTLIFTDLSYPAFTIAGGVTIEGVNAFWPGNYGLAVNPVVYPPFLQDDGTDSISSLLIRDVHLLNPFDVLTQTNCAKAIKKATIDGFQIYFIHRGFSVCDISEMMAFGLGDFNADAYPNVAGASPYYLLKYTLTHGSTVYTTGQGILAGGGCAASNGGQMVFHGTGIHSVGIPFQAVNQSMAEIVLDGLDTGGNGQILTEDANSRVNNLVFSGGMLQADGDSTTGNFTSAPAIDLEGSCGAGQTITITGSALVGQTADLIDVNGTNPTSLTIDGAAMTIGSGGGPTATVPIHVLEVNNANADVVIANSQMTTPVKAQDYQGIAPINVGALTLAGDTAKNLFNLFDSRAMASGTAFLTGNTTITSQATGPIAAGVGATGKITFTINPTSGTIVLNGTTWAYVSSGATGTQINSGASLAQTLANTVAALQASTDTNTEMFTYTSNGSTVLNLTAAQGGTNGSALTISTTVSGATASGSTLSGGSGQLGATVELGTNNWDIPPLWTFGQLGTCNSAARDHGTYQITDASASPSYASTVSAGGSTHPATVSCTGSAWTAH